MPTPAVESVEQALLDIARELLRELGSADAAARAALPSSIDRELGLGSLERVELLMRVERRFGRRLPDEVAQRAESLADFARALEAGDNAETVSRFAIRQPGAAPPPPAGARSFTEVLRGHAEAHPERAHIHLLDEDRGQDISYAVLYRRAAEVAAGLRERGFRPGETAAIMLPTCADFFPAFFGIVLAGGVAVPIYPPARARQIEEYVQRQLAILRNAGIRFLISFDQAKPVAEVMRVGLPSLIDVVSVAELAAAGRGRRNEPADPANIFFLQYTSGSTGEPKGVTLTHSNVLANVRGIGSAVRARPDDIVVSWLPLYHDMGLIGSWLFSLYHGYPITVLSPLDFLARPERWLWAMSDSRGTLCPAPNFSYELCVRKIEYAAIEGVDLSPWRIAINAGEPVMPATLQAFSSRFASHGFRHKAWVPCYGLAESSVALTFPPVDRPPVVDRVSRRAFETEGRAEPASPSDDRVLEFVANGVALPGHEVRVVDERGQPLRERARGRVVFRGPSRTVGYFGNPQATAAIIDPDGWMDSGDLGYFANGELYVTGRMKDCIIKSGHNIIPQDVENAAAEVAGVRKGCIAAFGAADPKTGTERLVVVAETRVREQDQRRRMRQEIVSEVSGKVGVPPDVVELVPPHSVPKTSSGKIRRNETRRLWESGQLGKSAGDPWLQVARLWLANLGGWLRLRLRSFRSTLGFARSAAWIGGGSAFAGLTARLSPSRRWTAAYLRNAVQTIAAVHRDKLRARGALSPGPKPRVLLANRSGAADAAALVAALPGPLAFAEPKTFDGMPFWSGFLLAPLALDGGEDLRKRIRRALDDGLDVVVFSDGPIGEPPERCRFRMEAFQAAADTGAEVAPVWLTGLQAFLQPAPANPKASIRVSDAEPVRGRLAAEWAAEREVLRARLAEFARESAGGRRRLN